MDKILEKSLEEKINQLREFVAQFNTESILGMISNDLSMVYDKKDFFGDIKLKSPYKQYMYLAGILTATDEKEDISMQQEDFTKIKKLLEEICDIYAIAFYPTEEEIKNDKLTEKWYEARRVSMPVFLDYFNTTVLNYEEQQEDRIRRWFEPYNEFFENNFKFSITKLLEIYTYIVGSIRKNLDNLLKISGNLKKEQERFFFNIDKGMKEEEARKLVNIDTINEFGYYLGNMNRVSIQELNDRFGTEVIESFLNNFSLHRMNREYRYYTSENHFERAPLLRNGDEYVFCTVYKQLLNAIFDFAYRELDNSNKRDKFYKKRDFEVEKQTEELLKSIFGDEANYLSSVFEKKDSHNEHDLLVIYKGRLIIVEVKASKVKTPFRNPDMAYTRIKRDFKSDKGIQKAYNQALNLKELIMSQERTVLYDKRGNEIINIDRDNYEKIYIFCITAENFGILASQLSLLLDKPIIEPYPWSCNLYDLESISKGFKYKKLDANKFLNYIDERIELHENLFSTDELEICGYYLQEGSFNKIKSKVKDKNTIMTFTPSMADIFDDIYYKEKGLNFTSGKYNLSFHDMNRIFNENLTEKKLSPRVKNKNKSKRKIAKASRKRNRK